MSKITKKDIKELKERYKATMDTFEKNIDILHAKIELIKGMIVMLEILETK